MNEAQGTERRFPIYRTSVKWVEDGQMSAEDRARVKWWPNDPGEGRVWNSMNWYEMYREEQDLAELERKAREDWWPEYIDTAPRHGDGQKRSVKNPGEPVIEVVLAYREEWCLDWFQHWTFDDGQTDAEVLQSFHEYVYRHEFYQDWSHDDAATEALRQRGIEHRVCLMGAEDRWRWCGTVTGAADERTDPPCRCEHCKAQGKIRIGH